MEWLAHVVIFYIPYGATIGYWRWACVPLLIVLPMVSSASDDKPSSVQDLRYGVALYHYFQRDYQAALSELLVADERGGIQSHGDSGQLMQGGLSLALGMERRAADIFTRLLDSDKPEVVRNTAWFYLGKLRYQRNDWQGAEQAFTRIQGDIPQTIRQELQTLNINLALRQQNFSKAQQVLNAMPQLTPWLPYAYYNLGVAYIDAGEPHQGVHYFDALAALPLTSEEHLALRDKARTAAGYSLMLNGQYQAAVEHFSLVRLASPLSSRAQLGYGWAAAELKTYAIALAPWQALAQGSHFDPSVQEALLAIPWLYEKVAAKNEALHAYTTAETSYTKQLNRIGRIREQLDSDVLLAALKVTQYGGQDRAQLNPDLMGLVELLAGQAFQNSANELQDLMAMRDHLQDWALKLDTYRYLLKEREVARQQKLQQISVQQFPSRIQALAERNQQFGDTLAEVAKQHDVMALASPQIVALWQIAERAEASIKQLQQHGEDTGHYRNLLRRYRGLLLWQANEQFSARLWQSQKKQQQLDRAVAAATENENRLRAVIAAAPEIAPYRDRLAFLEQRLNTQRLALDNRLELAAQELRRLVVDELERQHHRLQHYQSQARLSLARLYDAASGGATTEESAL